MEEEYLKKLVIALGGNAILQHGQRGTAEDQWGNLARTAAKLAPIISSWYQVVITHGNGPQVGNILIQNEHAKDEVPPMPLDVCGAQSQGQIGYALQQVLGNALASMGKSTEVLTVLTQTVVRSSDPAFLEPSKPIGPWFSDAEMRAIRKERESWIEIPGKGWRKTVPSPRPVRINNTKSIDCLLRNGFVVVTCGGGGIPVIETEEGILRGIEGVVDKDLASECLATELGAQILLMLTDVDAAYVHFDRPDRQAVGRIGVESMKQLLAEGHFPRGSIGPKVEAAIAFVEKGGDLAIIANLDNAQAAIKGKTGTIIVNPNIV